MTPALIIVGLLLAAAAIALLVRVALVARRVQRGEVPDAEAALRQVIRENGLALGLGFLAAACLLAAGILD